MVAPPASCATKLSASNSSLSSDRRRQRMAVQAYSRSVTRSHVDGLSASTLPPVARGCRVENARCCNPASMSEGLRHLVVRYGSTAPRCRRPFAGTSQSWLGRSLIKTSPSLRDREHAVTGAGMGTGPCFWAAGSSAANSALAIHQWRGGYCYV